MSARTPIVRLMPEFGHPSSLWTNVTLIGHQRRSFPAVFIEEFPVTTRLQNRLRQWTNEFHAHVYREEPWDGISYWKDDEAESGFSPPDWFFEGAEIAREISGELRAVPVEYFASKYMGQFDSGVFPDMYFLNGIEVMPR